DHQPGWQAVCNRRYQYQSAEGKGRLKALYPHHTGTVMQEDRENDSPKTIRSVVRALSVLNVIGGDSKGISAISKELQLSKGTVFDLIKTLEFMRYVAQDPKDGSYRVGPALLKLAVR